MISESGFSCNRAALFGHPETHKPQPMQPAWSTAETPSFLEIAPTWQREIQEPQARHFSSSMTAK